MLTQPLSLAEALMATATSLKAHIRLNPRAPAEHREMVRELFIQLEATAAYFECPEGDPRRPEDFRIKIKERLAD